MPAHGGKWTRLSLIALCIVGLSAFDATAAAPAPRGTSNFLISGQITGLYPGSSSDAWVHIQNPNNQNLVVTNIATSVADASRQCRKQELVVETFTGSVSVPAAGTATVRVSAMLDASAPDECQGVTFPLVFSGRGTLP